jgi:hypothetical protein
MRPKPPVFHTPIGWHRENGEAVLFGSIADAEVATHLWFVFVTTRHPATLAAGACVIISGAVTNYFDLPTHTVVTSPTPVGTWQPSALSDWGIDHG